MSGTDQYVAQLRIQVSQDFDTLSRSLGTLNVELGGTDTIVTRLTGNTARMQKQFSGIASAAGSTAAAVATASKSLNSYAQISQSLMTSTAQKGLGFNLAPITDSQIASYGNFATKLSLIQKEASATGVTLNQLSTAVGRDSAQKSLGFNVTPLTAGELTSYSNFSTQLGQVKKQSDAAGASQEAASKQTAIYNQYLSDEAQAAAKVAPQLDAHVKAYEANNAAVSAASKQTAIYNQYLFDESAANEKATAAQAAAAAAADKSTVSANAQRYALYNVSNALGIGGAALTGFAALAYKSAIDFQSEFANVARTTGVTGEAATALEANLVGLSQTTPISFSQIASIAAMGGQLGIATDQIVAFTKTTAEFTATTNVSTDDAATAFGRLDALLPDVQGNYNALGSAILDVGVNSVATESQIINITTRIAGISSTVGLTSEQVIGLSGALASLGVQPELAQGTITRLFTNIQKAISDGGTSLQTFAALSGKSADQFKSSWSSDATGTFTDLLNGINSQGPQAIAAIQSLGLSSTRDVPTLLKLAQNTDIVTKSFADAARGAANGTELNKQYGEISQTVAKQIDQLGNNFTAFLAALGKSSTGIAGFLGAADDILQWATQLVASPVGSTIALIGVALIGLTGIALLASAGLFRMAATMLAVQTAEGGAAGITGLYAAALKILTGSSLTSATAQDVNADSILLTSTAAGEAAVKVSLLSDALKAATIAGATWAALSIGDTWAQDARQAAGLSDSVSGVGKALDDLNKKQITQDLGLNKITYGNTNGSAGQNFQAATSGEYGSAASLAMNPGVKAATDIANQIPGTNILGLGQTTTQLENYDKALADLVNNGNATKAQQDFKFISDGMEKQGASAKQVAAIFPLYSASLKSSSSANSSSASSVAAQTTALEDNIKAITDDIDSELKLQNALEGLGETLGQGGDDFSYYTASGRANLASLETVIESYTTDAGGDSQVLAANLQGLFNAIVAGGYASANQLGVLQQAISSLGVQNVSAAPVDISSLVGGFASGQAALQKTENSAAGAAAQVKTLVDYANDLAGVFSRSFDIRFGGQEALDTIQSGWSAIAAASAQAASDMAAANATLDGLASNRQIDEYWLTVANGYGDTLRAAAIQADLAQNTSDTATAQGQLVTAQTAANKTLDGNSDAAIANRATVLGLVTNYESYIQTLAASGASQATLTSTAATLKQQFIQQATQLGFNSDQLGTYASAFDDVAVAIQGVPRNITVSANTNPALQALNEFIAQAKSTIGSGLSIPVSVATPAGNPFAAQNKAADHATWLSFLAANGGGLSGLGLLSAASLAQIKKSFTTITGITDGFADGGYTGNMGVGAVAGAVHGKEFVFSAPATRNIGVDNLAFLHNMAKSGKGYAGGGYVGSGGGGGGMTMVAQLSPADRQLLMDIRDRVGVTIAPQALAGAVSASNTNRARRGSN